MAYKGAMRTLTINGNTYQVSGDGLTAEVKEALLDCFEHVAWTDEHGQDYVDALEAALYPPANLLSISAVYTQSGTVYDTDTLDSLKPDLVVTALYDDQTTATVTNYTLSGTLTEGTSVITVSYGGKTTTFNVTVTAPATLSSITAVYTQSGTVYDTDSLDSLKSDLVVTAVYSDSSTETVASTDYTLSGTLTEGTSTITVSYGGKTTTFSVIVTENAKTAIYDWDLKSSLTDSVGGITAITTATFTSGTGLVFGNMQYCDFGAIYALDRTYELDVVYHAQTSLSDYGRFFMVDTDNETDAGGSGFIFTGSRRSGQNPNGYGIYTGSAWDSQTFDNIGTATPENSYNNRFFDGKTLKFYISSEGKCSVSYKTTGADDSTYVFLGTSVGAFASYTNGHVYIGSNKGDFLYQSTFSGLRVYEGEV